MTVGRTHDGPQEHKSVILCVEDEDDLRTDIVEELEEAGYEVIEARDGTMALAQIHAARPDLILCDINMPGRNGYDILRDLRDRRPDLAEVPFIFLTALADSREIVEGKRAGADDYLVKPVDFNLMLATIEARLREVRRIQRHTASEIKNIRAAFHGLHGKTGQNDFKGATQALDYIALGVILLDRQAHVLFANRAARSLADDTDGLVIDETLKATLSQHQRSLRSAIETAVQENSAGEDFLACMRVGRPSGGRDLMVVACSLGHTEDQGDKAVAVVFVLDSERRSLVPSNVLATLFGLTPAETQIAIKLAEGMRLDAIAASLDVSRTTIAFHMRNLFQKTNTNRQADLIALVLAGPMAMAFE